MNEINVTQKVVERFQNGASTEDLNGYTHTREFRVCVDTPGPAAHHSALNMEGIPQIGDFFPGGDGTRVIKRNARPMDANSKYLYLVTIEYGVIAFNYNQRADFLSGHVVKRLHNFTDMLFHLNIALHMRRAEQLPRDLGPAQLLKYSAQFRLKHNHQHDYPHANNLLQKPVQRIDFQHVRYKRQHQYEYNALKQRARARVAHQLEQIVNQYR